jgi:hypothetical protein
MKDVIKIWQIMPRSEKIGAIVFPPAFMAIFWAIWVMTPA